MLCKHLCPISYFSKQSLISKVQYFQVPLFFSFCPVLSSLLFFFLMVVGISARKNRGFMGTLSVPCSKSPLFPCLFSCFQRIRISYWISSQNCQVLLPVQTLPSITLIFAFCLTVINWQDWKERNSRKLWIYIIRQSKNIHTLEDYNLWFLIVAH